MKDWIMSISAERRWQIIIVGGILVCWQLAPGIFGLNPITLPSISAILTEGVPRILSPIGDRSLLFHTETTVREIAVAFGLGACCGILAGVVIGTSERVYLWIMPVLSGMFAVPLIVLIPFFLIAFGIGETSKMMFGAVYCFFPIVFHTVSGVRSVPSLYDNVGRAFGLRWFEMFYKVNIRGAAPVIASGLKIGLSIAIIATVSAEVFGSSAGLGFLIQREAEALDGPVVWALILYTLCGAWLLLAVFRLLIGRALRVEI